MIDFVVDGKIEEKKPYKVGELLLTRVLAGVAGQLRSALETPLSRFVKVRGT